MAAAQISMYTFQAQVTSCSRSAFQEECRSKCNEDFLFLSVCKAPAIILVLSSPKGSYYSIYINSPGLLNFVHTGQRKKKTEAIRGMPVERGYVLNDGRETALICVLVYVRHCFPPYNNMVPSCLIAYTRAHCFTEGDLASVAGGSFLLAIVCYVNGCKNIIRPVSTDRLPPLVPAATGEGMGVHINLLRNL